MLAELERLSNHRCWLSNEQEEAVSQAGRRYTWSAKENLERATDDLRNWWQAVDIVISDEQTRLRY